MASGQRGGWSTTISPADPMPNKPTSISSLSENLEIGRATAVDAMTAPARGHDLRNFVRSPRQHARVT